MSYMKNPRVQQFLKLVQRECKKCNVRVVLSTGYRVNCGGCRVQGYFESPNHKAGLRGTLIVGTGNRSTREWLFTLVHEYAHFIQWRDEDPLFNEKNYFKLEEATEKQAIALCRQYKLPIKRCFLLKEHRKYMKRLAKEG